MCSYIFAFRSPPELFLTFAHFHSYEISHPHACLIRPDTGLRPLDGKSERRQEQVINVELSSLQVMKTGTTSRHQNF